MSKGHTTKKRLTRFLSLMMAIVMILTVTVIPAYAATSVTKDVSGWRSSYYPTCPTVKVTSGKGLAYSLGLKKTTITIKNTGKFSVTLYEENSAGLVFYKGSVNPGQTKTYQIKGSNKTSTLHFQRSGGNTQVTVSVSAGSVS